MRYALLLAILATVGCGQDHHHVVGPTVYVHDTTTVVVPDTIVVHDTLYVKPPKGRPR